MLQGLLLKMGKKEGIPEAEVKRLSEVFLSYGDEIIDLYMMKALK